MTLFNTILCNTFLPDGRAQAIPAKIGTTINPTPVTDKVTDVVVAAIIAIISTDTKVDVSVF